jgi:hypothetical protein
MAENPTLPQPDSALRRLDRLVGRWSMEGHLVGSDEKSIQGETTFRWLPGGFFLEQHMQLAFMGLQIDSLELIRYAPETETFTSTVKGERTIVLLPRLPADLVAVALRT